MSKIVGRNARVLLGGRDYSGQANTATLTFSAEAPEVTTLVDNTRARLSSGIQDVEFTLDAYFGTGASEVDADMSNMLAASVMTGFYPNGYSASRQGYELAGVVTNYEQTYAVADAAAFSSTLGGRARGRGGGLYVAKALYQGTLSGTGASNLSSVDFSGSSDTSIGIVRCLTLSGTNPSFSACIQEANNDSTFTTIYAVTSVSPNALGPIIGASFSSPLASASRYRRVAASLSGTSPCATFFVASASF